MSLAALMAWIAANEASLVTLLLVLSELLGAIPGIKSNGIVSFMLLKAKEFAKTKSGENHTP